MWPISNAQVKHVQFRKHRWVSLVLRTERDGNPFTVGCESAEGGEERASVRLRLGCAGPSERKPCAACQTSSLDTHATCCALGKATRGHNAVTTLIHAARGGKGTGFG